MRIDRTGRKSWTCAYSGAPRAGDVLDRWERLGRAAGCDRVVHGRQVHGTRIVTHTSPGTGGLTLLPACDGHATDEAGTLLTVSVADCVPVFAVVPATRAVLLLHAGWRGAADGILEAGLELLERRFQARISDLWIHLGPAICGSCYEVGPEVHEAFGLPKPASPTPLDLRDVLATRALSAGATAERVSVSSFCTRCGDSPFFSHPRRRRGTAGRAARDRAGSMTTEQRPRLGLVGLCSVCAHCRVTRNRRGSRFHLCRLSASDARYPRYPQLPVLECSGFEANDPRRPRTDQQESE